MQLATSEALQVQIGLLNVNVHDSVIRERLNEYGLFEKFDRRKPLVSKKNITAWLRVTSEQTTRAVSFGQTKAPREER